MSQLVWYEYQPRDSLRLAVGAADRIVAAANCRALGEDAVWTVRDSAVASVGGPLPHENPLDWDAQGLIGQNRTILAHAPGRTYVIAHAQGFADSVLVIVPDTVPMPPLVAIGVGTSTSCAVDDGGTARCWGRDFNVAVSNHPSLGTCFGTPCSPVPVPRATDVESVHIGMVSSGACIRNAAGRASCWGMNYLSSPAFVEVPGGLTFAALTMGDEHTCGIATDGSGYCWGRTWGGRLGIGDTIRSSGITMPTRLHGDPKLVSIDAGRDSTCAVDDAGAILCWGVFIDLWGSCPSDYHGAVACQWTPLHIPIDSADASTDTVFVQVAGPCALTSLGSVYCSDAARHAYYRAVGVGPYVALTAGEQRFEEGEFHVCGLTTAGAAHCWGYNDSGQLGDGTRTDRSEPVPVVGGHVFTQLAAGSSHTCGLTTAREVWCWGGNWNGQVGVPIFDDTRVPRKVRGQP